MRRIRRAKNVFWISAKDDQHHLQHQTDICFFAANNITVVCRNVPFIHGHIDK